MKRTLAIAVIVCGAVGVGLVGVALGNTGTKGDDPAMMASPQTIVLGKVSALTVHTNIPKATVAEGSLTLNGAAPTYVWADDCGDIAARFAIADLGLTAADAVTLTLEGEYVDGSAFAVQDEVRVK